MPTILETYGYSPIETQLHSVAPAAAALVFLLLIAYISDKMQHRFLFMVVPIFIAIAGTAILLRVHFNFHAEYAAIFLVATGLYSAMTVAICWFSMNLTGHRGRAIGTGFQIGVGDIGGIISTFLFPKSDAPLYHTGYSVVMGSLCLAVVSAVGYFLACYRYNKTQIPDMVEDGQDETVKSGHKSRRGQYWL